MIFLKRKLSTVINSVYFHTKVETFYFSIKLYLFDAKKGKKILFLSGNAPRLPQAYSTNIRINFLSKEYTVEMKYATVGEKEVIEFKKMDRHVKYIIRKDQKSVLFIQYKDDGMFTFNF